MNLLGKAMDKNFWNEVRTKECFSGYREELLKMWDEKCENKEISQMTYSDFKLFWTTGDRSIYESKYFFRRHVMDCSALLALIYPEEEKYLIKLMDVIYAVCDEYTWCLPAHQGKLEPNNNTKIDLFASETAFALAEIYIMLGDRLEPLIKNRILAETERRIVIPFTSVCPYDFWETGNTNWTAVCMGSVACMFMLIYPDMVESLKPRFDNAMECFLSGFKDDGICLEGCSYWHYGFGFFTVYADMIRKFTDGNTDYFKRDKVKNISTFIQKMFLSGNASVSFADGSRSLFYQLGLIHYLKNEYPDDIVVYDKKYSYNYDHCGRFCLHLRSALWFNEIYFNNPAPDNICSEYYAPDSQWLIKRTESYGFAAKGGNNAEPHNHNDVGSFIFAKNGRQALADLGAGTYTRQYFSGERYSILECSSRGHSVPIIDGSYQFSSPGAAAGNVEYSNGIFTMDISKAYRCERLKGLTRKFTLTDDSVKLNDTFDCDGDREITERLVTLIKPEIGKDGVVHIGDVTVEYDAEKYGCAINDEPASNGEPCYFIDFTLKSKVCVFECVIK